MKLDNHIVYKVLTNPVAMATEVVEAIHGNFEEDIDLNQYNDVIFAMQNDGNKTYLVTKSVTEKLELLDTKKCMDAEGWKIFAGLPDFKKTYILPEPEPSYARYGGSGCVRIVKKDNICSSFT